jgi:hypothetical protein
MAYFELLRLILGLLPLIIDTIKAVEAAIPESGKGSEKLQLIRAVLENAWATANNVTATFEAIWPMLNGTITAIVTTFNKTGIFKK